LFLNQVDDELNGIYQYGKYGSSVLDGELKERISVTGLVQNSDTGYNQSGYRGISQQGIGLEDKPKEDD
jgi:hypothetical protein